VAARQLLLRHTVDRGIPLVEDAAYQALRFEGPALRPCLALDIDKCGHIDKSLVIYCGTFSKTVAPGLRVGWVCAARDFVHHLVLAKQAADLHSPTLNQIAMHRVASASYVEQIDRITTIYAQRRDAMLSALTETVPSSISWTHPRGGMFIWVTLPSSMDARALLEHALREHKVAFVPGQAFFADASGANTLRLSFSLQSEPVIRDGIQRLARAIASFRLMSQEPDVGRMSETA
jgi:DNA-binding transcriptional MocR family regulator